ncbi:MAG TPA: hypothetical protein VNC50_20980, partial [Planctomycetia bacterium]|nr:hypothetical protein [Planctomycetia bacterium]
MRPRQIGRTIATLALLALAAWFLVRFHQEKLYGTGPDPASRLARTDILAAAVGLHPTNPLLDAARQFGDLSNFPERLTPLKVAGGMLLFALLVGDSLLRLVAPATMRRPLARLVFAYGLGTGATSLLILGLGLVGKLGKARPDYLLYGAAALWSLSLLRRAPRPEGEPTEDNERAGMLAPAVLLFAAPFLVLSLCSALLPTPDYDSLAYHLLAPKEWWERGKIEFLPHNVYAAFPFLAEMYHLAGMHLAGDWFLGGVTGQAYLWTFAAMGAVATGALTANLFGLRAGWIAFFLYATTPWTFRLAAIPYVEGATLYFLAAGLLAARLGQQAVGGAAFVAGAMAGCAAACKYTNILMVVPPLAVLTIAASERQRWLRVTLAFGLGAALM